jgi:hypothetical protein
MDLSQELNDSELLQHIDSFEIPLQAGKDECIHQLKTRLTSSTILLYSRQNDVLTLRANRKFLDATYKTLQGLKNDEKLIEIQPQTETEKAASGQIFFENNMKPLNTVPFLITILVFCKIWIFPVLGLMTPLFLLIMPYIILQNIFGVNVQWDMYVQMMKQLVLGINGNEPWALKHYLQVLWTIAGVGQGIVQPFITSYHTAKVDDAIVSRGNAFINIHTKVKKIYNKFKSLGLMSDCQLKIPEIPYDVREVVYWMDYEPIGIKIMKTILGRITILTTIAYDQTWNPVTWDGGLKLHELCDLAIPTNRKITSSLDISGHNLLTGPNRGGKSSSLRAILQQVLLGQTFGFTKNASGSWTPFYRVLTRLKSRDTAGKESLFEMEVRNASRMIHTTRKLSRNCLILIDELFHSTNPPDAEISARMFLDQLWKLPKVKSIISTHIFTLCENPPDEIKTLCCPASENNGTLEYTYKLKEGVCRVSSVNEVLKEAGLCA